MPWRRIAVAGALALGCCSVEARVRSDATAAVAAAADAAAPSPLFVAVTINGTAYDDVALLKLPDGGLLARKDDWLAWRLRLPTSPARIIDGEPWWDLRLAPGFRLRLDEAAGSAALEFAAAAFVTTALQSNPSQRTAASRPQGWGGYLNYDLLVTHQRSTGVASTVVNGQFETVAFHPQGSFGSQWAALDLGDESRLSTDSFGAAAGSGRRLLRLDSNWRHDDVGDMTSLTLGDAIGAAGLWGFPNRYGGVQFGRNFTVQPGFITLPQPSLAGSSSLPSVLDVFVDGVRRDSQSIPAGPFSLSDIPAVNGQGEVQVVVRDLLGREQVLSVPYLSGIRQLRQGLNDYSWEAGWLRENFGRTSDDYGRFAATFEDFYGFTNALTGEGRLELRGDTGFTAGSGAIAAVPMLGVVTAAVALSSEDGRGGGLGLVGWQHYFGLRTNIGLRATVTTRDFVQTGQTPNQPSPLRVFTANAGLPVSARINLGLAYVYQRNRAAILTSGALSRPETGIVTASLTTPVGRGALSLQAFDRTVPGNDVGISIVYTRSLGAYTSGSLSARQQRPDQGGVGTQFDAGVERSLPTGEGWGWRALAVHNAGQDDERNRGEVGAAVNTGVGSASVEAAVGDDERSYRAGVSGALASYGGHWLPSRRIPSSFAIADAGAAGVPVRVNGVVSGVSNTAGMAILPDLLAYQANQVMADAADLPLEVELQQNGSEIAPYFRSGLQVQLGIASGRNALVTLLGADGKPLPASSVVRMEDGRMEWHAARGGLVYVEQVDAAPLRLRQVDGRCRWQVRMDQAVDIQARLGPYACEVVP